MGFLVMEIRDVVHGTINIPSDIATIIRSPQFQRLKAISQLGLLHMIVPHATHTRFDHCIGTYWQAKKMLDGLEVKSEWITNIDKWPLYRKAVEIAALLHDIGHGPFSHSWEQIVDNYNHEENAAPCVDFIFESLDSKFLPELRDNKNYGIELIKALIVGEPKSLPTPLPPECRFLFEIVHNTQCKLDVDKWDYLKRDHHFLKHISDPNMDFDDVFLEARVSNDGAHIEYRYKDYDKIYALFVARWRFHLDCYRLPESTVRDKIVRRIVKQREKVLCGKGLADITAHDKAAFLQLTDSNVLALLKDDVEYAYLQDNSQIRVVDKDSPFSIITEEVIRGPGDEMPQDDQFHFYGNEREKNQIKRNMESTKRTAFLLLSQDVIRTRIPIPLPT